jgi:hypothetical protein
LCRFQAKTLQSLPVSAIVYFGHYRCEDALVNPGASATYWRAVEALREAESLAQLSSSVSGPADEPPKQESDEPGWVKDWTERAKKALDAAGRHVSSGNRELVSRGRRIAKRIFDGSNELMRRVLIEGPQKFGADGARGLKGVTETAQKLQVAWGLGTVAATVLLAYVGYKLWLAKGHSA